MTGMKWDLRNEKVQAKAMMMIKRDRPDLIICSPPCTMFSQLQTLSGDPQVRDPEGYRDAVTLMDFAVKVCLEQLRGGRHFVLEHPLGATSWKLESLVKLRNRVGVLQACGHMSGFGMEA